jgi:DNA-binding CsgD family transcriptional regulator
LNLFSIAFAFVGALCWAMAYRIVTLDAKSSLNRLLALGFFLIGCYELASSVNMAAPNDQWYWPSLVVASAFFLGVNPVILGSLLDFAGIRGSRRWLFLFLPSLLSLVQLVQLFTGTWLVSGYHQTPWGNVYEVTDAWWPNAVGHVSSAVSIVTGLGALWYAWSHSHSRLYRALTVHLAVLSLLSNLWGAFCIVVIWKSWGLPDPTGFGAAIVLVGYGWLIQRYQHLTERKPDMTSPLLAFLRGTALFANTKGIVVLAPPEAVAFFDQELVNCPVTDILPGHPGLADSWASAIADGRPRLDFEGTLNGGKFRVSLYPHRNPFNEVDGALVRVVPETPLDEAVVEFDLSAREREVAQLICDGYNRNQVAEVLCISPSTVKNHLHSIFQKTQATGQTELVRMLLAPVPGD